MNVKRVMLKNADKANNADTGPYTAGGRDQRAPPPPTWTHVNCCIVMQAVPT